MINYILPFSVVVLAIILIHIIRIVYRLKGEVRKQNHILQLEHTRTDHLIGEIDRVREKNLKLLKAVKDLSDKHSVVSKKVIELDERLFVLNHEEKPSSQISEQMIMDEMIIHLDNIEDLKDLAELKKENIKEFKKQRRNAYRRIYQRTKNRTSGE